MFLRVGMPFSFGFRCAFFVQTYIKIEDEHEQLADSRRVIVQFQVFPAI